MARAKKEVKKDVEFKKKETEVSKGGHGGRFHVEFLNSMQKIAWGAFQQQDVLFLCGPAGTGKSYLAMAFAINEILQKKKRKIILTRPLVEAGESMGYLPGPQPLDVKIITPFGYKLMGELNVGDLVIGRDGNPTKVLKIFPKGKKKVYRVNTTDSTSTECCEDHLWLTTTSLDRKRGRKGTVKSTKQIIETLLNKKGKINHHLPRNEPVKYEGGKELPIPPYTLGALLGDGSLGNGMSISNIDKELLERVDNELNSIGCILSKQYGESIGYAINVLNLKRNKTARIVRLTNIETKDVIEYESIGIAERETQCKNIKSRCAQNIIKDGIKYEFLPLEKRWMNPLKNAMEDLGLFNKKALNKFIPDIYKYSSVEDRINLLRGLMDTDGCAKKTTGEASFTTISKQLAQDVIEIVRSLGGRATLRGRNRVGRTSLFRNRIIRINHPTYEFNISLPKEINPFYISRKANRFAPKYMHGVGIKSIEEVGEKEVQCILVDNNEHLYLTDNFLVTHNTQDEKIYPYMLPLYDSLSKLVGESGPQRELVERSVEVAPLNFCRGRTFDDSICIFDEAQNATMTQLKLFLTRLGKDSKMIITGDPTQSDIPVYKRALMDVVYRLETLPGVSVVNFKSENIVRHSLISKILERLDDSQEDDD